MELVAEKFKPGLRDYWQIFLRRKWVIILPILAFFSISIPGSYLITPVYEASTTLVSQEVERGSILQEIANIPVPQGEEMNTVRYRIETRSYMKEVADRVNISRYLESIGKPSGIDDVVRYLREITSFRARGSKIIEIDVLHANPEMAKSIADAIADNYYFKTLGIRQEAATASSSFINQELEIYREQLRDAEEALLVAQQKGILAPSSSQNNNGLVSEIAKIRTDLVEVELDLQEAKSQFENAKKFTGNEATNDLSPFFSTNPEIVTLQAKLTGLKAQYAELTIKYTDQYPEARNLKASIIKTQDELDKAKFKFNSRQQDISARVQYWNDRVKSLEIKRSALDSKVSEYNRKLQQLPQQEMELARLQREKAVAEATYSMLLQRLNESELLRSSEIQNMGRVAEVDHAVLPVKPVRPNRKKIAFLALGMGVIIGFGATVILEYFDRSFRSADEALSYLGIPVLAAIPRLNIHESKKRKNKFMIILIIFLSLLALIFIADMVSPLFIARNSFIINTARKILNPLTP